MILGRSLEEIFPRPVKICIIGKEEIKKELKRDGDTPERFNSQYIEGYKVYTINNKKISDLIIRYCDAVYFHTYWCDDEETINKIKNVYPWLHRLTNIIYFRRTINYDRDSFVDHCPSVKLELRVIVKIRAKMPIAYQTIEEETIIPDYPNIFEFPRTIIKRKVRSKCIVIDGILDKSGNIVTTDEIPEDIINNLKLLGPYTKEYIKPEAIRYAKLHKFILPDGFNNDPNEECTNGIHFFLSLEEAADLALNYI